MEQADGKDQALSFCQPQVDVGLTCEDDWGEFPMNNFVEPQMTIA